MHVIIDYIKEGDISIEETFVHKVVERAIEKGGPFLVGKNVGVEVVFVDQEEIRALNRKYRGKDAVTDVLSFGDYESREAIKEEAGDDVFLGQVFVCYDYVVKSAEEDEVSLTREFAFIVSHGVLHLLGYDHEEEMFEIQDTICDAMEE